MTVLIVEDNTDNMKVILEALKFNDPRLEKELSDRNLFIKAVEPASICKAANLEEANKAIDEHRNAFDLAILDLLIPKDGQSNVNFQDPEFLGYDVLERLRDKFGDKTPVVIYSNYLRSDQNPNVQREGLRRFFEILRKRAIAPPNEVLWKDEYSDSSTLMRKLVKYAIDLSQEDEKKLQDARILVPRRGPIRRVLRELKRMASSSHFGFPHADVLLLGENGVGKTTFARAYHLLRPRPTHTPRLAFQPLDLGTLDYAGSAPNIALFGATDFNGAWSMGAFARSTLYKRGPDFLCFPGQEIEHESSTKLLKHMQTLDKVNYPEINDEPDFDGSGTLFLDEVVNVGVEIQAMLLQAISYDLYSRHVYTTGHAPRRLRVAPTLVFATAREWPSIPPAQNAKDNEIEDGQFTDRPFRRMKDYIFRIDQMRVTIPPLRQRESEEIVELLTALVRRRRPPGMQQISIDPLVLEFLEGPLRFTNNVADLQRIADQVMPEESTLTWQHIAPLYAREFPHSPQIRTDSLPDYKDDNSAPEQSGNEYLKALQAFERYRATYVELNKRCSLAQLQRELDITRRRTYNLGLVFLDLCGCNQSHRWPQDAQAMEVFNHGTKMFQTYLRRLAGSHQRSFGLESALEDLLELKRSLGPNFEH